MTTTRLFTLKDLMLFVEETYPTIYSVKDITFVEEVQSGWDEFRPQYDIIFSTPDMKLWKATYSKNALDGTEIWFDRNQMNGMVACIQVEAYQKTITAYREI